jgi:hypothetical protein
MWNDRKGRLAGAVLALVGLLGLAAGSVRATDINIDFSNLTGVPAATYGAAAGQPGVWNNFGPGSPVAGTMLLNTAGAPSGATITVSPIQPGFFFPNPGPTGDDAALLNDLLDLGVAGTTTVTIAGLAPGLYNVYTYAWAPDRCNTSNCSQLPTTG